MEESEISAEQKLADVETLLRMLAGDVNESYQEEAKLREQIKVIEDEVKLKVQGLVEEINRIKSETWEKRRQVRKLNEQREQLARLAEEEKANKALLERYLTLQEKLDAIKSNFPWSEKAYPHQIEGSQYIALYKRIILADVMGLGKTLTAIAALDFIQEVTKDASLENIYKTNPLDRFPVHEPAGKKVLYLSSAELSYGVWEEFRKWAPHRNVVFLTGSNKIQRRMVIETLKRVENFVLVMNYEAWRKDLNILPLLADLQFDTVIFDEAHKLKEGEKNIGFRGVASITSATPSPFRIAITGSPILNKPQELFPQLQLLDPYMFYNQNQFLNEYCVQVEDDDGKKRWTFRPGGIELLYRKIGPIILRRTKEQVGINLPDKTIEYHLLDIDEELYPHQARARKEMRTWGSIALDPDNYDKGFVTAAVQIAVLTRLRQIEVWPAGIQIHDLIDKKKIIMELDVHESQKLDYILNPVAPFGLATEALGQEDGKVSERLVIFSQFVSPLKELHRRFQLHGFRSCLFIGETSREEREQIKRDFDATQTPQEEAKYDIILANYKVGGEGVNFTGASQMIILDEEWNPSKRDQAYDRIHRIGQQKPITIHVVRTKGTVDEWLASLIEFKEGVVGGFETTFSNNEAFNALKEGKI